ncbi:hypothetical protein LQV05_001151 [Cryptococcus neoformans]|nr:hypothetical protein LQV05_001151 [Cryptococcus neoformans]
MSEVTLKELVTALPAFHFGWLNPHLDRGMTYVYPKYLLPLFFGTHLLVFCAVNIFHPYLYKEEIPHFNQVSHYARGDFEYHDESIHTSTLWHYAISTPFYLLGITPTLSALRLTCLSQALLLPAILTIVLAPTPFPTPFFPHRFANAFCEPKEYAVAIGLNSIGVLMASRFTPGISCLLGLLVLWRSVLKRRYWIGAGVAAVVGIMKAGVMVWTVFVLGWVAWGIPRITYTSPGAATMTLTPPSSHSVLQPPSGTFARLFPVRHIIFDQLVLEDPRQYCTLSRSTYKVAIRLLSRKLTITNNNYQKVLAGLASKSGRERLALIHFEHLVLATTNLELLKSLQLETDCPVFARVSQLEFVEKFPWGRLGDIHYELGTENIEDILARHIPAKVFIINIRNPITQGYGYGPALDRISMLLAAFMQTPCDRLVRETSKGRDTSAKNGSNG